MLTAVKDHHLVSQTRKTKLKKVYESHLDSLFNTTDSEEKNIKGNINLF